MRIFLAAIATVRAPATISSTANSIARALLSPVWGMFPAAGLLFAAGLVLAAGLLSVAGLSFAAGAAFLI